MRICLSKRTLNAWRKRASPKDSKEKGEKNEHTQDVHGDEMPLHQHLTRKKSKVGLEELECFGKLSKTCMVMGCHCINICEESKRKQVSESFT